MEDGLLYLIGTIDQVGYPLLPIGGYKYKGKHPFL